MMKLQTNASRGGDRAKTEEHLGSGRSWLQWSYFWGILLFLGCIVVQVFLAGLAILVSGSFIQVHKTFGYVVIWFPVLLLLLGLAGRLPRSINRLTALLVALAFLQPVLIRVPYAIDLPIVAALHPVNALAIFSLPLFLCYQVRQCRRHGEECHRSNAPGG